MDAVIVLADIFCVNAYHAVPFENCGMKMNTAARFTRISVVLALSRINGETILITLYYLQIVIEFVQSQNGIGRRIVVVQEIVEITRFVVGTEGGQHEQLAVLILKHIRIVGR